jgi:drug/metabolite transporter (DMT)-like permease
MKLSIPQTQRAGIGLALGAALISGFAIYINGFAVKQAPGALSFTLAKNMVAALIIAAVLFGSVSRGQIKSSLTGLRPTQWLALGYVGLFSGGLAFALFFQGLTQASSTEAAFVQKSLIIWVVILAIPILGEKLGLGQVVAIGLLLLGQFFMILGSGTGKPGTASALVMIFAATLIWAIEIVILRKLLRSFPVPLLGTIRLGIGAVVLLTWLVVSGGVGQLGAMGAIWPWMLVTGVLLSGYVLTWFGALRRAQAVDVTAILVVGAFVTALLAMPSASAISVLRVIGMALIVCGVAVLIKVRASPTAPAIT